MDYCTDKKGVIHEKNRRIPDFWSRLPQAPNQVDLHLPEVLIVVCILFVFSDGMGYQWHDNNDQREPLRRGGGRKDAGRL
jgi:hypothetical protein